MDGIDANGYRHPWLYVLICLAVSTPALGYVPAISSDYSLEPHAPPLREERLFGGGPRSGEKLMPLDQRAPDSSEPATLGAIEPSEDVLEATPQELIGRTVTNAFGEDLGVVEDVVRDRRTEELGVVVAVDAAQGQRQSRITLPLQRLESGMDQTLRFPAYVGAEQLVTLARREHGEYQAVERTETVAQLSSEEVGPDDASR